MDRDMLQRHVKLAERHVAEGARHLARQREIVAELAGDGRDLASAKNLLAQFEARQAAHLEDRDRIRAELAALQ
jgi:hypothetical protein